MIASYWPELDQPSVSRMMWRRVAVAFSSDPTAWSSPAKMFVWPCGWMPAMCALEVADRAERLRLDHPVGRLVEGHHAELVPGRQRRRGAQDRLLADVDLAHAGELAAAAPAPNVLQWQASIEPDLSITTTSAMSGSFCRLRTPMSTGSVSSIGVFV